MPSLLLLQQTYQLRRHRDLLDQVATQVSPHLILHHLMVELSFYLNPLLLVVNGGRLEVSRKVWFGHRPRYVAGLKKLSKLSLSNPVFDLIGWPARQMSGNVFPAISEPYISLFEYLIFLPGPGGLFEVGVKVVAVSLSEVLALLSWKGKGKLVPFALLKRK